VFSAKLDGSDATRHVQVPLVIFHLQQAALPASAVKQATTEERQFKEALLAIIFASLCLEAFSNETAESALAGDELEDFFRLRGKYKRDREETGVAAKGRMLFRLRWSVSLFASRLSSAGGGRLVLFAQ